MQYSSLHRHPPLKTMQFFPLHPRSHCAQQPYPQYREPMSTTKWCSCAPGNIQPTVTNYVRNHSDCCFNISEDRHFVLEVMDVAGLSKGRGDVYETWLWTASSLSGTMLTSMDVSVLCI